MTLFFRILLCIFSVTALMGCAAKQATPEAMNVELVNYPPDLSKCRYVGDVVGSQGNWITGDFTPNKNLIIGARNELRNQAYKLGANVVYIQNMASTNASSSLGTTNTTAVGKAYRCIP